MKSDTIAAISTAPGVGGVAIIRISGSDSLAIAEKAFRPLGKTAVKDFEPYKMYVGEIDGGSFTDFGMCVFSRVRKVIRAKIWSSCTVTAAMQSREEF